MNVIKKNCMQNVGADCEVGGRVIQCGPLRAYARALSSWNRTVGLFYMSRESVGCIGVGGCSLSCEELSHNFLACELSQHLLTPGYECVFLWRDTYDNVFLLQCVWQRQRSWQCRRIDINCSIIIVNLGVQCQILWPDNWSALRYRPRF